MATTTNATLPATRAETADMTVLGSLPLLQSEDGADYERWCTAVIDELKPADLMEKIWTNDIIYLEWEIMRFRRAKANYIRIAEAQIDVVQVRAARLQLIAPGLNGEETFVWSDVAKQLRALDRCERRALSRRKRASEDLDTICVLEAARSKQSQIERPYNL